MLWTLERLQVQPEKIGRFCRKFAEYDERYFDKPYQTLVDELYNYADWKVEHVKYTKDDYPHYKSKVMQASVEEQMRCANEINALSTRYFTYGFTFLSKMDSAQKADKL